MSFLYLISKVSVSICTRPGTSLITVYRSMFGLYLYMETKVDINKNLAVDLKDNSIYTVFAYDRYKKHLFLQASVADKQSKC